MVILYFLLPSLIWGARKEQIDLVQERAEYSSLIQEIALTLQEKKIKLVMTDLKNEKDHLGLGYIVIWDRPASITPEVLRRFAHKKPVLFLWEPEAYDPAYVALFKRVYTWNDDLVDNQKFFKFYYPVLQAMAGNLLPFEKRKLVTHNPKEAAEFRFCICKEKVETKGYISEKIFQCFAAGCVPIYTGSSNVTDYIPSNCFIDGRKLQNLENISPATYEEYLNHIREFLKSDEAHLFSKEMFQVIFLEAIRFP